MSFSPVAGLLIGFQKVYGPIIFGDPHVKVLSEPATSIAYHQDTSAEVIAARYESLPAHLKSW